MVLLGTLIQTDVYTKYSLYLHVVFFISGKFDDIYKNLVKEANTLKTFDVYKKDQLPNRWHMKNTPRLIGIIYLLAKSGYVFWDDYIKLILNQTSQYNMNYVYTIYYKKKNNKN